MFQTGDIVFRNGKVLGTIVNNYGSLAINQSTTGGIRPYPLFDLNGFEILVIRKKGLTKLDQAKLAVKANFFWGKMITGEEYVTELHNLPTNSPKTTYDLLNEGPFETVFNDIFVD